MKPWKRKTDGQKSRRPNELQWGHGDEAVEELVGAVFTEDHEISFNGATAMKPWNSLYLGWVSSL